MKHRSLTYISPEDRERFLRVGYTVDESTGCHLWAGALDAGGYGRFSCQGRTQNAHRVAYRIAKGGIPKGMVIMHSCDIRQCINPDHLTMETHRDNVQDMIQKNRAAWQTGTWPKPPVTP